MGKLLKKSPKKTVSTESGSKSLRKVVGGIGGVRRPFRFRPGTVVKREIRREQKSTKLLLKKAPFRRVIVEVAQDLGDDIRFRKDAKLALQVAVEAYLIERFRATQSLLDQFNTSPIETLKPRHTKAANDVACYYPGRGINTQFAERRALGIQNPYLVTRPRKEKKSRKPKKVDETPISA